MIAEISSHREELRELCRRFHVRRLDLFGSATGDDFDAERSDLDFLVEFEPEALSFDTYPKGFLWDARSAATAIADMTRGRSFADFDSDLVLRSAVERQFEILGEALNRLARLDAALAARIPISA